MRHFCAISSPSTLGFNRETSQPEFLFPASSLPRFRRSGAVQAMAGFSGHPVSVAQAKAARLAGRKALEAEFAAGMTPCRHYYCGR
jgi:hypothetical protein